MIMTGSLNSEETPNPGAESPTSPEDISTESLASDNAAVAESVNSDPSETRTVGVSEPMSSPPAEDSDSADKDEAAESEKAASSEQSDNAETKSGGIDAKLTLRQAKDLAKELKGALEDGQLKECISLYEQCQARLKKLEETEHDPASRKKLQKKLNKFQFEIQQLKKWRNWSMNQARQELIDQLIALKRSEEHPRELHTKLKSIRDQWHKWNKTGDFPNQKLRQSFTDAYNEAFEPCKEFFKEQKRQRKQNKQRRKNICADLERLFEATDWGHQPDWRVIGEALRNARKQWKSAVPLNKKDWDTTNAQFDEVMDRFQPYLEQERQKGIQFREELIRKANALDAEPVKVAIDRAKIYQKDWKTVVIRTRKKKENELWKDFKSACDRQFQRRADMFKEKDRQRKENSALRQNLLSEIRSLNQLSPSEIKASVSKLSDIQQRWRQTRDSGKGKPDALQSEFNNEVAKFHQSIKQANKLEAQSLFVLLEKKAEICETLEQSHRESDTDSVLVEIKRKWESCEDRCGEYEDAIQRRFSEACQVLESGSSVNSAVRERANKNFEEKKSICLQLEVLTELDSPPAFAKERMRYNVERLNAVMTKRSERTNSESEVNDLMVQYWLTGAVPEDHYNSINERFQRIRSAVQESIEKIA